MSEDANQTPAEKAKVALDCIMPPLIATTLRPHTEAEEVVMPHLQAHWKTMDDDTRLAAFEQLAVTLAVVSSAMVEELAIGPHGAQLWVNGRPLNLREGN